METRSFLVKIAKISIVAVFIASSVLVWPIAARAQSSSDEKDELQEEYAKVQKKLEKELEKKKKLEGNLSQINASLGRTLATINQTRALLRDTTDTIKRKELEVRLLEQNMGLKRELLADLVRRMYESRQVSVLQVLLAEEDFSQALDEAQQFSRFEERVNIALADLGGLKEETENQKANLEDVKENHEDLLADKAAEKQELAQDQAETQADIASQEKVISRLKKELDELQGDLQKILGKSYNAKDIKEAVSFASKETGVPKGFLFGVLKMETNLGANVGGCTYAQVEEGAEANYKKGKLSKRSWQTFQSRRETFKSIAKELDIDYRKQKVSCNPKGYTGTGGAMGVAQFMPDTWNGYKSQVTSITGHRPPSPWNLTDGVTAMALKLKRIPGVTDGKKSAMKQAACSYLGTCYAPYINGILYWADNYKQLL